MLNVDSYLETARVCEKLVSLWKFKSSLSIILSLSSTEFFLLLRGSLRRLL